MSAFTLSFPAPICSPPTVQVRSVMVQMSGGSPPVGHFTDMDEWLENYDITTVPWGMGVVGTFVAGFGAGGQFLWPTIANYVAIGNPVGVAQKVTLCASSTYAPPYSPRTALASKVQYLFPANTKYFIVGTGGNSSAACQFGSTLTPYGAYFGCSSSSSPLSQCTCYATSQGSVVTLPTPPVGEYGVAGPYVDIVWLAFAASGSNYTSLGMYLGGYTASVSNPFTLANPYQPGSVSTVPTSTGCGGAAQIGSNVLGLSPLYTATVPTSCGTFQTGAQVICQYANETDFADDLLGEMGGLNLCGYQTSDGTRIIGPNFDVPPTCGSNPP